MLLHVVYMNVFRVICRKTFCCCFIYAMYNLSEIPQKSDGYLCRHRIKLERSISFTTGSIPTTVVVMIWLVKKTYTVVKIRRILLHSSDFCYVFFCENGPVVFSDTEVLQSHIQYIIFSFTYVCNKSPEKLFIFITMHDFVYRKIYSAGCAWFFMTMCINDATVWFVHISKPVTLIKSTVILFIFDDNIYLITFINAGE